MFNVITKFFALLQKITIRASSGLTRNVLIFALVATLLSIAAVAVPATHQALEITILVLLAASLLEFIALLLVLRGSLTMAKVVVPIALIFAITIITLKTNTIHDVSVVAYPVIIIIATLLQGKRSIVVTTPLAIAGVATLGILDRLGFSNSPLRARTGIDDIVVGIVSIIVKWSHSRYCW